MQVNRGQGSEQRTEALKTVVWGVEGLVGMDTYGPAEETAKTHRRNGRGRALNAAVVEAWDGKPAVPGGELVFLTNRPVTDALRIFDRYDDRSLIENADKVIVFVGEKYALLPLVDLYVLVSTTTVRIRGAPPSSQFRRRPPRPCGVGEEDARYGGHLFSPLLHPPGQARWGSRNRDATGIGRCTLIESPELGPCPAWHRDEAGRIERPADAPARPSILFHGRTRADRCRKR